MPDKPDTLLAGKDDTDPGGEPVVTPPEDGEDVEPNLDLITPAPDDDKLEDGDDSDDKDGDDKDDADPDGDDKDGDDPDKTDDDPDKTEGDEAVELDIPEGVIVDETVMTKFKEVVKELGLSKDQAQKVFDLQVEMSEKADADFEAEREGWLTAIAEDEKYGGDNLEASKEAAKKAMKRFSTPEMNRLLIATGFGDHPELFKTFANIGKAIGEADFIEGALPGGGGGEQDQADIMFGDMPTEEK